MDDETEHLEVAHIIPYALISSDDGELILVRSSILYMSRETKRNLLE